MFIVLYMYILVTAGKHANGIVICCQNHKARNRKTMTLVNNFWMSRTSWQWRAASSLCKQKSSAFISDWLIGTGIIMGSQQSNQKWQQSISTLRALTQSSPLSLTSPQWWALKEHAKSKNALFPHPIVALGLPKTLYTEKKTKNSHASFACLHQYYKQLVPVPSGSICWFYLMRQIHWCMAHSYKVETQNMW